MLPMRHHIVSFDIDKRRQKFFRNDTARGVYRIRTMDRHAPVTDQAALIHRREEIADKR